MVRRYGPADQDPDPVPVWDGIARAVDYDNVYYGYGYGYASDQLLWEGTMALSREMEEVVEAGNMAVDGAIEAMNQGVDAAIDGAEKAANEGLEAAAEGLNGLAEKVMSTSHRSVSAVEEEEGGLLFSTRHAVNNDVDEAQAAALEAEEEEPSLIEQMGEGSWQVGQGLTAWAEAVQQAHWESSHKSDGVFLEDQGPGDGHERQMGEVFSTATHSGIPAAALEDEEEKDMGEKEAQAALSGGFMAAAFASSSGREDIGLDVQMGQPQEELQASMDGSQKVDPEFIKQSTMELMASIDFGSMFQRDYGLDTP